MTARRVSPPQIASSSSSSSLEPPSSLESPEPLEAPSPSSSAAEGPSWVVAAPSRAESVRAEAPPLERAEAPPPERADAPPAERADGRADDGVAAVPSSAETRLLRLPRRLLPIRLRRCPLGWAASSSLEMVRRLSRRLSAGAAVTPVPSAPSPPVPCTSPPVEPSPESGRSSVSRARCASARAAVSGVPAAQSEANVSEESVAVRGGQRGPKQSGAVRSSPK